MEEARAGRQLGGPAGFFIQSFVASSQGMLQGGKLLFSFLSPTESMHKCSFGTDIPSQHVNRSCTMQVLAFNALPAAVSDDHWTHQPLSKLDLVLVIAAVFLASY